MIIFFYHFVFLIPNCLIAIILFFHLAASSSPSLECVKHTRKIWFYQLFTSLIFSCPDFASKMPQFPRPFHFLLTQKTDSFSEFFQTSEKVEFITDFHQITPSYLNTYLWLKFIYYEWIVHDLIEGHFLQLFLEPTFATQGLCSSS